MILEAVPRRYFIDSLQKVRQVKAVGEVSSGTLRCHFRPFRERGRERETVFRW